MRARFCLIIACPIRGLAIFRGPALKTLSSQEKGMPTVAIVIPSYNRRRTIGAAIQSALNQSCKPNQIIVVDDASSDGTFEYVSKLYPGVTIIRMRERGGACVARNNGIKQAEADYVAFLDSDDTFMPNKIEYQLHAISETGSKYATCGFLSERGLDTLTTSYPESRLARFNFRGGTSGLICEKSVIEKVLFDSTMLAAQDWDVFLRLSEIASGVHCPKALYAYGTSEGNRISRSKRRRFLGHVQLYRKNIANTNRATLRNKICHKLIQVSLAADIKSCKIAYKATGRLYRLLR